MFANNPFDLKAVNELIDGETVRDTTPQGRQTAVPNLNQASEPAESGWYVVDENDKAISPRCVDKNECVKKLQEYKRLSDYKGQQLKAKHYNSERKQWAFNESVNEERSVNDNAASKIEQATSACMEVWYSLTQLFNGNAEKFDPYPVNPSEKFMHFKLAPGGDAREDAYKKITEATERLVNKLNEIVMGNLFVPEIVRKDGHLEVRARYQDGKGGIFHVKSSPGEVGVVIKMTMPKQGVIRQAFRSLFTTPEFPIGDDIPEPENVVPDQPQFPDDDQNQGQPQQDTTQRQRDLAPLDGQEQEDRFTRPRRESVETDASSLKSGDHFSYNDKISDVVKKGIVISNDTEARKIYAKVPFTSYGYDAKAHIDYDDIVGLNESLNEYKRRGEMILTVAVAKGLWYLYKKAKGYFSANGAKKRFKSKEDAEEFAKENELDGYTPVNDKQDESLAEGKYAADGFEAPTEGPGYYVVYGTHQGLGSAAKWNVVSHKFNSKREAVDAKDNIMQQKRATKGSLWNRGSLEGYHVKYWDGDQYHQTSVDFRVGDVRGKESPDVISKQHQNLKPETDDAPLDQYDNEQDTYPNSNSQPYVNQNPNDMPYRMKRYTREEVAANAVGTGAINSGVASPDPYSDTRDAMKRRRTTEKANATKMWRRAGMNENTNRTHRTHDVYFWTDGYYEGGVQDKWWYDDSEDHGGFDRNVPAGPFGHYDDALLDAKEIYGENINPIIDTPPRYKENKNPNESFSISGGPFGK